MVGATNRGNQNRSSGTGTQLHDHEHRRWPGDQRRRLHALSMKDIDPPPQSGSTDVRRAFWNKALAAVMNAQKKEGRNVTTDEHQGHGTFINIGDSSQRRGGGGGGGGVGACCYDDGTCDDLTEADCTEAGGNWQGPDTTCDDDPSPCVGACCIDGECFDDMTKADCETAGGTFQDFQSTCDDPDIDCTQGACCNAGDCTISTEEDCLAGGGVYQGGGTVCDPNPCTTPPCNGCGFDAFDGSGRKFLTNHIVVTGSSTHEITEFCANEASSSYSEIRTQSYDSECNFTDDMSGHHTSDDCDGNHCEDETFTTECVRSFCAIGCTTETTITATTRIDITTCDSPGVCHADETVTRTLSNECMP